MDQDQGPQPPHIPWLAQGTFSCHYLEINPQTLSQVSSFTWMDHEDYLVGSNPRVRIKYATTQSSQDLVWISSHMDCWIFLQDKMKSLSLAYKQG